MNVTLIFVHEAPDLRSANICFFSNVFYYSGLSPSEGLFWNKGGHCSGHVGVVPVCNIEIWRSGPDYCEMCNIGIEKLEMSCLSSFPVLLQIKVVKLV